MDPYIGEIMMVPYTYAPRGWAFCNGQTLPIQQNHALFSLLGTAYGGDGQKTFGLPDLRGRSPVGVGKGPGRTSRSRGDSGGEETVTLSQAQMPAHDHQIQITEAKIEAFNGGRSETANATNPDGTVLGNPSSSIYYQAKTPNTSLGDSAVKVEAESKDTGGSQAHPNMPPFTSVHFIIALQGVYPPRS